MSFGKNLQYLRQLSANMTQETLAEKLNVSRQTISKWEMDAANPEMDKALEICKIFNCSLDNLFREEMDRRSDAYSNLRTEDIWKRMSLRRDPCSRNLKRRLILWNSGLPGARSSHRFRGREQLISGWRARRS